MNQTNMLPAAVGTLQKSHAKSWFKWMHRTSPLAGLVFSNFPNLGSAKQDDINVIEVVVLQAMLMANEHLLVELVLKSDYE